MTGSQRLTDNFDNVLEDYNFFVTHSDEFENEINTYSQVLSDLNTNQEIKMLDHGSADGKFAAQLLTKLNWPKENLKLTLLEPGETGRLEAVEKLNAFTSNSIPSFHCLKEMPEHYFNFILSNHVLYYIEDLSAEISRLTGSLATPGILLIAMTDSYNPIIKIWKKGFEITDQTFPYHLSIDVKSVLEEMNLLFEIKKVDYEISFPDTKENRTKILRFLFSDHFPYLPINSLLETFSEHSSNGKIHIPTYHDLYVIKTINYD